MIRRDTFEPIHISVWCCIISYTTHFGMVLGRTFQRILRVITPIAERSGFLEFKLHSNVRQDFAAPNSRVRTKLTINESGTD